MTQIFEHAQGEADIDPDVAEMEASASRVDVVPAMYAEPQAHGSVEVAVDDLTDPRLVDAGVPEARQAAQAARQAAHSSSSVASSLPQRRLSRTVPEKRTFFSEHDAHRVPQGVRSYSRTSRRPP